MLGLLGSSVIGINHLTGPTGDATSVAARLARHEVIHGKPVLQDLGDDAAKRSISFSFDETFCAPDIELAAIEAAFRARVPLRLFLDIGSFQLGFFIIENLKVTHRKTARSGRVTRAELSAELIEADDDALDVLGDAAASIGRAVLNPFLKRGV